MSKIDDLTGKKFSRLLVLYRDDTRPGGHGKSIYWICQCDCGNIVSVSASNLKNNSIKSCGCLKKEKNILQCKNMAIKNTKPMIGKTFGRWTVIKEAETKNKIKYYTCQCSCDKHTIKDISGESLRRGLSKSCGCIVRENNKKNKGNTFKNEIGNKYGKLTVISLYPKSTKDNRAQWVCECDCGNIAVVSGKSLRDGHTNSCGCMKSKGEQKIKDLFLQNNIKYIPQFIFEDLIGLGGGKLIFDFGYYDINNNFSLLEYQGEQHYNKDTFFGKNTIIHDNLKKDYCYKNNIPLIEIPYTDYDKIDWEYLKEKCNL